MKKEVTILKVEKSKITGKPTWVFKRCDINPSAVGGESNGCYPKMKLGSIYKEIITSPE